MYVCLINLINFLIMILIMVIKDDGFYENELKNGK